MCRRFNGVYPVLRQESVLDTTSQEPPEKLHSHCIIAKFLVVTGSSSKPEVARSSIVGPASINKGLGDILSPFAITGYLVNMTGNVTC